MVLLSYADRLGDRFGEGTVTWSETIYQRKREAMGRRTAVGHLLNDALGQNLHHHNSTLA